MGFKAGDVVQLKEKFAGRRYKGKVLKIRSDFGEKLLVVSQPNNMIASFPEKTVGISNDRRGESRRRQYGIISQQL